MSGCETERVNDSRYQFVPSTTEQPTIVGGEGCWLLCADGRRILDAAAGAVVGNIGWGRSEVADATHAAMVKGAYSVPIWPSEQRLALRDRLVERWLPQGFTQVFFTSGGSESTDSALRLARGYQLGKGRPERWKVVGRHPSYHGLTLAALAVASHDTRKAGFEPLMLPFPKVPWDDPAAVVEVIEREGPETIAGFIAEPITGAAGACLTASDEYWQVVTDTCHRYDILMITDEVMCGYGRTGLNFGFQHFPFEPDVIVGGKGLGGGYVPMGAVAARDEVAAVLKDAGFMYFTFTGNDAACAASVAVLDIMEREGLVDRAAKMGAVLGDRLHAEFDSHPAVIEVRGRGMFYGIELNIPQQKVVAEALSRDVWIYPAGSGPVPSAVMIAPPFVITDDELDQVVTTLKASIDAVIAR
jgi:adenosylmethionine-8-amino-7-oxononanoate aminotransferase